MVLLKSILYVMFVILLIRRDIGGTIVNKYLFIALAAMMMLIGSDEDIYCFISFATPLFSGIPLKNITLLALFFLMIKHRFEIKLDKKSFILCIIILILELGSIHKGFFSMMEYVRFIAVFLFTLIFLIDRKKMLDYKKIIYYFLTGTAVMILILCLQMLKYYSLSEFLSMGQRFGNVNELLQLDNGMRISLNPNDLGIFCNLAICFVLLLKKDMPLVIWGGSLILFLLVGIMTQSRTFIIAFLFVMMMYVFWVNKGVKRKVYAIAVGILIGSIAAFLLRELISQYLQNLIRRFTQVNDITNGRNSITLFYVNEMFQSAYDLLFGVGMQNINSKYNTIFGPHNVVLEIIVGWGGIGLVCVVCLFYRICMKIKGIRRKIDMKYYIPIVCYFVMLQTGQGFSLYFHTLSLIPVCAGIWLASQQKEAENIIRGELGDEKSITIS